MKDWCESHKTGKGYVAAVDGQYYDAIHVKKIRVVPMIIEAQGGITPHALAHIGYLARRAKGRGARDSTNYGRSRTSTKSFFVHHCQRLALAAQQFNAKAILKSLSGYKHQLLSAARRRGATAPALRRAPLRRSPGLISGATDVEPRGPR